MTSDGERHSEWSCPEYFRKLNPLIYYISLRRSRPSLHLTLPLHISPSKARRPPWQMRSEMVADGATTSFKRETRTTSIHRALAGRQTRRSGWTRRRWCSRSSGHSFQKLKALSNHYSWGRVLQFVCGFRLHRDSFTWSVHARSRAIRSSSSRTPPLTCAARDKSSSTNSSFSAHTKKEKRIQVASSTTTTAQQASSFRQKRSKTNAWPSCTILRRLSEGAKRTIFPFLPWLRAKVFCHRAHLLLYCPRKSFLGSKHSQRNCLEQKHPHDACSSLRDKWKELGVYGEVSSRDTRMQAIRWQRRRRLLPWLRSYRASLPEPLCITRVVRCPQIAGLRLDRQPHGRSS